MIYLDTSVLVAALLREPSSQRVHDWLGQCEAGSLLVSDWTGVEFASALGLKLRTGQIDEAVRRGAWQGWQGLLLESLHQQRLEPADHRRAIHLLDDAGLGLRSGDALHLAITLRLGAALATLDKALAAAARAQGVEIVLAPES